MPLSSGSQAPTALSGEVSFLMEDGEKAVRVDVGHDVLALVERPRPQSPDGYLARFGKYRDDFERIASAKYDRGSFGTFANSCVIPITAADWVDDSAGK